MDLWSFRWWICGIRCVVAADEHQIARKKIAESAATLNSFL